jgi:hypothetical protein
MKRPLTLSAEVKARLQELGESEIDRFIGEISDLRDLIQFLPTVPGFRKQSKAGIEKQRKELARRLCSRSVGKAAQDRDYRAFFSIWRAWVLEKMGERKATGAAIDAIQEALDAPDSENKENEIAKAVAALFRLLGDRSADGKCARENIERAIQFSLFNETLDLRASIGGARTATEIERAAEFEELPKRLRQDENEISSIKLKLQEVATKVDRLGSASDGWSVQRASMLTSLSELRASLEKRIEGMETRVGRSTPPPNEPARHAMDAVKSLGLLVDDISAKVSGLSTSVANIGPEQERRINSRIDELLETFSEAGRQRIDQLANQLSSLQERVNKEIETKLTNGIDQSVLSRLDEIEEALTAKEEALIAKTQAVEPPLDASLSRANGRPEQLRFRIEAITRGKKVASTSAASFSEIAAVLALGMQELGLKASAAKLFAEDACAASLIGQAVFFKGAYSTEVARLCARTLCSGSAYRVSMPIGIQSGDDFRSALEGDIRVDDELVVALVVEGVNLAAFEIVKDVLADLVNGAYDQAGQTLLFATVSQGVASLPIEPSYIELGPIIDLDCLEWRSRRPVQSEGKHVALSVPTMRSVRAGLIGKSIDTGEAHALVRSFVSRRNPRVEHTVLSAYAALAGCRQAKDIPTALQSLVFGWLVPYWNAHHVSKSDVDSAVDGGKCDSVTADPRIVTLLNDLDPAQAIGRAT